MIDVGRSTPTWAAYLETLREEVCKGIGIFSEDEYLRTLLQECFDRGDAVTGTVLWNEPRQERTSDMIDGMSAGQ
jgi:hypothetical protein